MWQDSDPAGFDGGGRHHGPGVGDVQDWNPHRETLVKRGMWICVVLLASCSKQPDKGGTEPPDDPDRPNPVVLVETSMGDFKVELAPSQAPKTVANFLGYVDDKFYDGTIF